MINLLPYNTKKTYKTARMNVTLIKYIVVLGFSAGFLVVACMVTYLFIYNNKSIADKVNIKITSNPIQKKAETIRTDLSVAKNILDQQVPYSDLITGLATNLPAGTVLRSLSISDNSFGGNTELKILSRTSDIEPKIKENFEKSSLFSNYRFVSTASDPDSETEYPFTINVSISINRVTPQ